MLLILISCCQVSHLLHSSCSLLTVAFKFQVPCLMHLYPGMRAFWHCRISCRYPFWLVPSLGHKGLGMICFMYDLFLLMSAWEVACTLLLLPMYFMMPRNDYKSFFTLGVAFLSSHAICWGLASCHAWEKSLENGCLFTWNSIFVFNLDFVSRNLQHFA